MKKLFVLVCVFVNISVYSQIVLEDPCGYSLTFPTGYEGPLYAFKTQNMEDPSFSFITNRKEVALDSLVKEQAKFNTQVYAGNEKFVQKENKEFKIGDVKGWLFVYEITSASSPQYNTVYVTYFFNNKGCNVQISSYTRTTLYESGKKEAIFSILKTLKLK